MTVLWFILAAFTLGGVLGVLLMAIIASGPSAQREWEAYRRGYQLGLTEPRQ